jgi:DnaJ-class molecular chaperone
VAELAPLEIHALARIIDELDYYQLLHLERGAMGSEIKAAYYSSSRAFHPDATDHTDAAVRSDCARISKRISEAYAVLRDPRRRKAYDEKLASGEGVRMQLSEARATHSRRESEARQGRTPQGRQFYQKAQADLDGGDLAAAVRNLQTALTFEPDNAGFQALLEDTRARAKAAR